MLADGREEKLTCGWLNAGLCRTPRQWVLNNPQKSAFSFVRNTRWTDYHFISSKNTWAWALDKISSCLKWAINLVPPSNPVTTPISLGLVQGLQLQHRHLSPAPLLFCHILTHAYKLPRDPEGNGKSRLGLTGLSSLPSIFLQTVVSICCEPNTLLLMCWRHYYGVLQRQKYKSYSSYLHGIYFLDGDVRLSFFSLSLTHSHTR